MRLRLSPRLIVSAALVGLWLLFSNAYVTHTPGGGANVDMASHLEYTQLIVREHRLPRPGEIFEGHQPPLYYLINLELNPKAESHIDNVRHMGSVYGALAIAALLFFLTEAGIAILPMTLATLAVLSTPAFLFTMTGYNNDGLAMALAAVGFAAAYRFVKDKAENQSAGLVLLFSLILLFYTKDTGAFLLAGMVGGGLLLWKYKLSERKTLLRLGLICCTALFCMLPLVYRTYQETGKPFYSAFSDADNPSQALPEGAAHFLLRPPGITDLEWDGPFVYGSARPQYWTKRTYFSTLYATSLFGLYNLPLFDGAAWLLVWSHLAILIFAFRRIKADRPGLWVSGTLIGAILANMAFVARWAYTCHADFRLLAWMVLPLGYLYAIAVRPRSGKAGTYASWGLFALAFLLAAHAVFAYQLLTIP
jgi:hypothetical protein